MFLYMPKDPVVYDLINKTKIIVVRQMLRRLMKRNFIVVSEEGNYILIPEILINNLEAIEKLITVANDENKNIKYLIFQRQDFTCMTCGETGRPLKIAYLTSDKNINDLGSMVALCDQCYELMTKNEILIDGNITFEVDFLEKKKLKSLEFLIQYHPELKDNETVIKSLENWENDFNINDVIKALTITIDRIKKNKVEGTVGTLISYTSGILRKTAETGDSVNVYGNLNEQYDLEKWIEGTFD